MGKFKNNWYPTIGLIVCTLFIAASLTFSGVHHQRAYYVVVVILAGLGGYLGYLIRYKQKVKAKWKEKKEK